MLQHVQYDEILNEMPDEIKDSLAIVVNHQHYSEQKQRSAFVYNNVRNFFLNLKADKQRN